MTIYSKNVSNYTMGYRDGVKRKGDSILQVEHANWRVGTRSRTRSHVSNVSS